MEVLERLLIEWKFYDSNLIQLSSGTFRCVRTCRLSWAGFIKPSKISDFQLWENVWWNCRAYEIYSGLLRSLHVVSIKVVSEVAFSGKTQAFSPPPKRKFCRVGDFWRPVRILRVCRLQNWLFVYSKVENLLCVDESPPTRVIHLRKCQCDLFPAQSIYLSSYYFC